MYPSPHFSIPEVDSERLLNLLQVTQQESVRFEICIAIYLIQKNLIKIHEKIWVKEKFDRVQNIKPCNIRSYTVAERNEYWLNFLETKAKREI